MKISEQLFLAAEKCRWSSDLLEYGNVYCAISYIAGEGSLAKRYVLNVMNHEPMLIPDNSYGLHLREMFLLFMSELAKSEEL